jgi:hypothetical protein
MPESDLTLDASDKVLLASLAFTAGGALALVGLPAVITAGVAYGAFAAAGSLAVGITGFGVWTASNFAVNDRHKQDLFDAYKTTAGVALALHDPKGKAIEFLREQLNDPSLGDIDEADVEVLTKPPGEDPKETLKDFTSSKLTSLGEDLLEDTIDQSNRVPDIVEPISEDNTDVFSDNQCREKDETRDFMDDVSEPSEPPDHPMCEPEPDVPVNTELGR